MRHERIGITGYKDEKVNLSFYNHQFDPKYP